MKSESYEELKSIYKELSTPRERFDDLMEVLERLVEALDPEKLRGRDGEDGQDGLRGEDADHEEIARKVLAQMKPAQQGKPGKDAREIDYEIVTEAMLGKLKNKKMLDISIFQLKDWQDLYRAPGNVIGGNSSGNNPPSGGSIAFETPSGIMDGTNTSFTVVHIPLYIVINQQTYFQNDAYTLTGLTISLDPTIAPVTGSTFRSAYTA